MKYMPRGSEETLDALKMMSGEMDSDYNILIDVI